jgi:GH24 family phage-related lysozyme (muramidase)
MKEFSAKVDKNTKALVAIAGEVQSICRFVVMLSGCVLVVGTSLYIQTKRAAGTAVNEFDLVMTQDAPLNGGDRIGIFTITSGFGMRNHPIHGTQKMHEGVDVDTPEGYSLVSPIDGKLECLDDPSGYGIYAIITPKEDRVSTYLGSTFLAGHLSYCNSILKEVKTGQEFGKTGNTGGSTGAHLHWEQQRKGKPIQPFRNPLEIALKLRPSQGQTPKLRKGFDRIDFIAKHEGVKLKPYADSGGIATIGYGATTYEDGRPVKLGDSAISEARAKELLGYHLKTSEQIVNDAITVPLSEEQKTALISFAFNTGTIPGNVATAINSGDLQTAADIMNRWVHDAAGNRLEGLVTRRKEETAKLLGR